MNSYLRELEGVAGVTLRETSVGLVKGKGKKVLDLGYGLTVSLYVEVLQGWVSHEGAGVLLTTGDGLDTYLQVSKTQMMIALLNVEKTSMDMYDAVFSAVKIEEAQSALADATIKLEVRPLQ